MAAPSEASKAKASRCLIMADFKWSKGLGVDATRVARPLSFVPVIPSCRGSLQRASGSGPLAGVAQTGNIDIFPEVHMPGSTRGTSPSRGPGDHMTLDLTADRDLLLGDRVGKLERKLLVARAQLVLRAADSALALPTGQVISLRRRRM